jgi:REP-associated tyrosine transposase
MPRAPRKRLEGRLFHVTTKGVAKARIFRDDEDRERFLWQLGEVSNRCGWRVVAWCLMGTQ